jgi:lysophospholipase L1-like esterase
MALDALIPGGYRRYVALGDSFTEGVGDTDPRRPNGVRGWADRVAEVMGEQTSEFAYANLAVRGRGIDRIAKEQVAPAIALEPDVVTIYGGSVDLMWPHVDIDALLTTYESAIEQLVDSGAKVLVFTAYGARATTVGRLLRGRFAVYNEAVREIAQRRGATLVDFWRMTDYDDAGYWDGHGFLGPSGHRLMAIKVLDTLGVRHHLPTPNPLVVLEEPSAGGPIRRVRRLATRALPWAVRRVVRGPAGDGLSARYPRLTRLS